MGFETVAIALISAASIVGAGSGMVFSFDGSLAFFRMLADSQILFPVQRYGIVIAALPGWVASRLSTDLGIIRIAYSLGYALIPAFSFALCAWIIRPKDRGLLVWPALGITFGTGLLQTFYTHEGLIACLLAWPVLLQLLTGESRKAAKWVSFVLVILIFWAHPGASMILLALALAAALGPVRRPRLSAALLALALVRVLMIREAYETSELDLKIFFRYISFRQGTFGLIAVGFGVMLGGIFAREARASATGLLRGLKWVAWSGAIIAFSLWCMRSGNRAYALAFRQAGFFTSFIFYGLSIVATKAAARAAVSPSDVSPFSGHAKATVALIALHSGVILALATGFMREKERFFAQFNLAPGRCVALESLSSLKGSSLDHWSITYFALIHSGREPTKIVAKQERCDTWARTRRIILDLEWEGKPRNYFDLSRLTEPL